MGQIVFAGAMSHVLDPEYYQRACGALGRRTVEECMALMTECHIRHLPVVDETQSVLGILSIGDLVKETISRQAFMIEQLERYITG